MLIDLFYYVIDQLNNPGIIFLLSIVLFMYIFKLQLEAMSDKEKE